MRRIILLLFSFTAFGFSAYSTLVEYKNKYLRLLVDDINYRFTLQREFIPSGEYSRNLLFFDIPPTSYISFKVDNLSYKANEGNIIKGVTLENDSLRFSTVIDGIEFDVTFNFIPNSLSKVDDCLQIKVFALNLTNISKNVNVRYLLDTIFGENESLPKFFLDGKTAIDYELLIDYKNMVSYVVSSSDVEKVNNLYIYWKGSPARILFSNWRKLDNSDWFVEPSTFLRYRFSETSSEDCAIAIFFENINLSPNQSTNFVVFLSTTPFSPVIEKEDISKKEEKIVYEVTKEEKTNVQEIVTNVENIPSSPVTNLILVTNEIMVVKTQEVVLSKEVVNTNRVTNILYITNFQNTENIDEIKKKIDEIENRLSKLTESMDLMFSQITNISFYQKTKDNKEVQKDIDEMKKIRMTMGRLSKTLDTVEERIAVINKYIEIRKKFSDKRLIVYTDEEYKSDLKLIEEIEKILDEIMNILMN
ncbi:MAG: hypothetical protein ACP5KI_00235 [Brevinematia bacterium]